MAKILVIDDDIQTCASLKRILNRKGYEIIEAADGAQGIKLYKADSFDLIISDILMPNKDGLEVLMEMKRLEPRVKIIMISGGGTWKNTSNLEAAKLLGALGVFTKPYPIEELLELVDTHLNKD